MKEYIIKVGDKPDIEGNYPLEEKPKELIRCKDCRFNNLEITERWVLCALTRSPQKNDWFCADGERKEIK